MFQSLYFPDENIGAQLKGSAVAEIEDRLSEYSTKDLLGYENVSEENLPDDSEFPNIFVYAREYEVPYFEGESPLDATTETSKVYSISGQKGHYFIWEDEEVGRHFPDDVTSDFYTDRR